jgi:hypothetical protein
MSKTPRIPKLSFLRGKSSLTTSISFQYLFGRLVEYLPESKGSAKRPMQLVIQAFGSNVCNVVATRRVR